MNDSWTDEELATLLAHTFASHESLADPEIAQEVAASAPAVGPPDWRRWPAYVAAVASVIVVAGVGAYAVTNSDSETPVANPSHSPSTASTSPSTATTAPAERTYAENHAAAAAESARVVELAPLPEGAERLDGQPKGWPPDAGVWPLSWDGSLTRTAWWSVPAGAESLQPYFLSHEPPGMHSEDGVGESYDFVHAVLRFVTYAQDRSPDPGAFVGVNIQVQWLEVDGRTLVRADTFTAAREARTADTYIESAVTGVDIEQVESGMERDGGGPLPTVHLTEPADHARIARLVDTVNGLYASTRPVPMGSCPDPGDPPPSVTVTFHTSADEIVLHQELSCFGQVTVRRDGRLVSPTLDPGHFYDAVQGPVDAR